MQREHAAGHAPVVVRGRRRCQDGAGQEARAEAMEEWLFANQPQLTPDLVKQGSAQRGRGHRLRRPVLKVLELVKSDIAMGAALQVYALPRFSSMGVRIPIVKPE